MQVICRKNQHKLGDDMILIMGLPNAGKTTYSAQYENVLHFDEFRKFTIKPKDQYELCNKAAAEFDGEVCVEGIYNSASKRKELLEAVKDNPEKNICIWLDTSVETCEKREDRGRPKGLVRVHKERFEPPTYDEGWDEIIIINEKEG